MEQHLEADNSFEYLKYNTDSIGSITLLESMCYNYKVHEYTPLTPWDTMDKLTRVVQPEDVHEVKHYETFKSVIEMCKASKISFALMYIENINEAMDTLYLSGEIPDGMKGSFDDGKYLDLTKEQREVVNKTA